jgi:hypothetical protein
MVVQTQALLRAPGLISQAADKPGDGGAVVLVSILGVELAWLAALAWGAYALLS